jgi:hypothetical protein
VEEELPPKLQAALDELPAKIAARLTPKVELPQEPVVVSAPVAAEKPKLAKVVICGLTNAQGSIIEKEFSECFDVYTLEASESVHRLRNAAASAKYTILMANFISHRHQEVLCSANIRPITVHGGISTLRNKLTELYVEGIK